MDWYRRKTWTPTDEQEFHTKLSRARKDGRAQYLKIQAVELVETEKPELLHAAESLLLKLLNDHPDDKFNRSSSLNVLGRIYKLREDYNLALDYYGQSLEFEKIYPSVRTSSYLDYAELVIKLERNELYEKIKTDLEQRIRHEIFPVNKYKTAIILSAISHHQSNFEAKEQYLNIAKANSNAQTSGLRYHKFLGLVSEKDKWLENILKSKS